MRINKSLASRVVQKVPEVKSLSKAKVATPGVKAKSLPQHIEADKFTKETTVKRYGPCGSYSDWCYGSLDQCGVIP